MPRLRFLRPLTRLGLEKMRNLSPNMVLYWTFLLPSSVCLAFTCFNQCFLNLYGLDLPEHSKLKFDYGASPIGIVKTTLQNWGAKRNRGEFEDIIIVGLDDAGFENTFNFSTMISYVEIDALRDDNYRFAPDNVRVLLLAKLGA